MGSWLNCATFFLGSKVVCESNSNKVKWWNDEVWHSRKSTRLLILGKKYLLLFKVKACFSPLKTNISGADKRSHTVNISHLLPTILRPRPWPGFLCSSTSKESHKSSSLYWPSSLKTVSRTLCGVCRSTLMASSWLAARRSIPFTWQMRRKLFHYGGTLP